MDDAQHPTLRRSRPLGQTELEAFRPEAARRLAPDVLGPAEVREVDARTALTVCGLPGNPWALSPYVGCAHGCVYCYVPEVQRLDRARWSSYVIVKRNLPVLLSRELKRKDRRPVYLSSGTDCYQAAEAHHLVTRRSLELLARADWPLRLLTRSPLVRRDIDLLTRFSDAMVGMSVPTLDDELRRAIEPGAPPIEARLRALRALADAGLRPFVSLIPAYPLMGAARPRDVARSFAEAGVACVHLGAWQYLETVLRPAAERLPPEIREEFVRSVQDVGYVRRQFRALAAAFRREGVRCEIIGPEPQRFAKREVRWVEGASGVAPARTPT